MPASTSSKSDRSGGSIGKVAVDRDVFERVGFGDRFVDDRVLLGREAAEHDAKHPHERHDVERKTSAGDSSSRGGAKSNGLMWCSELSEILK
jgi:hypothetical protein